MCLTWARAISAAPPPGNKHGSTNTLRATCIASCKFLSTYNTACGSQSIILCTFSTSFKISLLAPRRTIVQALGSLQRVRNVKYSSPIFLISNRPHRVPTSLSCNSSVLFAIVAPTALAVSTSLSWLNHCSQCYQLPCYPVGVCLTHPPDYRDVTL